MEMDLTQIRSFVEVAERGTVAAAAAVLGYTPPAVSQHLSKLERGLGSTLFDRAGGHLVLTDAGMMLLPMAHDLLDLAGRARAIVHQAVPQPRLVVAGLASALAVLVTPRVAALAEHASVEIVEAEDRVALRELRLGYVDLALVQEYPGDAPQRDPRLDYTTLLTDDLRLVLPPWFSPGTTIADLDRQPWLVNGTGTRCEAASRQILRMAGIEPTISADVSDNHLLLHLVAAGHGATIVPDLLLADVGAAVTVSTQDLGAARTLLAVTRTTASAAVRQVLSIIGAPA
jgi:DNA-binding transcriptional LysR family regulator